MQLYNKPQLRKYYSNLRSSLDSKYTKIATQQITNKFFDYIKNNIFKVIAVYYPIGSEPNFLNMYSDLRSMGYLLALPRLDNHNNLSFCLWHETDLLEKNLNTPQPTPQATPAIPDLIITPLLATDINRNRLGYGKGCYDRALETYRNINPQLVALALCYKEQVSELSLPNEKHDQKLDIIITN